ncbi:MAG: hypothetical protein ABSG51_09330 [Terracidiphilus sp.]|jgi:hypothetical protein
MAEVSNERIHTGSNGKYSWLVTEDSLSDILRVYPDVVVGKQLVVTSFDSGPLPLSDEEKAAGWESRGGIAYSPRVVSVNGLPHDDSYDEWYVFNDAPDLGRLYPSDMNPFQDPPGQGEVLAVVNYHLLLHLPEQGPLAGLFWKQMDWIAPVTYLADCQTHLACISHTPPVEGESLEAKI